MPLLLFVDHNSYFAHNTAQRIRFLFPYLFIFTFLLATENVTECIVVERERASFYANDMSKQTLDESHKENECILNGSDKKGVERAREAEERASDSVKEENRNSNTNKIENGEMH